MMVEALDAVESGGASFSSQDHARATYCKMIEKTDARIDWRAPARDIRNRIRAFVPWPVAQSTLRGQILRMYEAHTVPHFGTEPPGTIVEVSKDGFTVSTGEGGLTIDRLQAPGKREMSAAEFLRGHALSPGERFSDA
jgi:methionyl-tRNA formyltransferase